MLIVGMRTVHCRSMRQKLKRTLRRVVDLIGREFLPFPGTCRRPGHWNSILNLPGLLDTPELGRKSGLFWVYGSGLSDEKVQRESGKTRVYFTDLFNMLVSYSTGDFQPAQCSLDVSKQMLWALAY
jgi:AraC-like DNA-binding protein